MSESEEKKYIVEFLNRMNTQDNRCTATPFYYVIRSADYIPHIHQSDADRYAAHDRYAGGECYYTADSLAELFVKIPREYLHIPDDFKISDLEEMDDYDIQACIERKHEVYYQKKTWKESGVFLTETDAMAHLKANSHHYSDDAHTYVHHIWRAPELENFIRCLFKYFEVEQVRK